MKRLLFLSLSMIGTIGMPALFSSAAESLPALSLEEVLEEVIKRNPEIASAEASSLAARERIPQAQALQDPQFGITQWEFPANFNILKANETWYTLSQTFPFFGKRALQATIAGLESAAADEESRSVHLKIITEAKQAYFDFFFTHKAQEIHRDQVDLSRRFSQIAQGKLAVGEAGQQDVIRAQVELLNLNNTVATLEQERQRAAARLNTLLNRPVSSPLGIPEAPALPFFEPDPERLQAEAEEGRPENRIQALEIKRNEEAVRLAKRDTLPDLMAEVGYMDMRNLDHDAWMATVKISIPWFNKKKYDARIREAEATRSRAKAARQAALNDTRFRIKELSDRFETAKRSARLYEEGLRPLAEQMLEAAVIGYQTRKNDFLTLIDAQKNLKELELAYLRSVVDANKHLAELEEVAGRGF